MSRNPEFHEPDEELGLEQVCRFCGVETSHVEELVAEGVIEPVASQHSELRFSGVSVTRVRRAQRLRNDLGVNLPGVALALDLLDEIESLRCQLRGGRRP